MLVFICGGDAATYERVGPLLDSLGRARFHLGPLGCGNVGKLVNSLMAFTATWVSLEGLAIGARHDIDLRHLVEMMRTAGATQLLHRAHGGGDQRARAPARVRARSRGQGRRPAARRRARRRRAGAGRRLTSRRCSCSRNRSGLGGRDFTDLVEVMERIAGVHLELARHDER